MSDVSDKEADPPSQRPKARRTDLGRDDAGSHDRKHKSRARALTDSEASGRDAEMDTDKYDTDDSFM